MNIYEAILQALELEEGDEFLMEGDRFPSGDVLRKFENGKLLFKVSTTHIENWQTSNISVNGIMQNDIKITLVKKAPWTPKIYENYYVPNLLGKDLYLEYKNTEYELDMLYIKRKMVFKTSEEAIACAKKMLEVVK